MIDSSGRNIEYLRLSLTQRCTLRCTYCRAAEGICPKKDELGAAVFERLVRLLAKLGIKKVRLTGGEPMLRYDLLEIISRICAIEGILEVTMTTNAQHLAGQAAALKKAGLSRLNISIDSLQKERYHELTGGGDIERVLLGIDEALTAGLVPLKLNTVLMRGINDDEIDTLMLLAKDRPLDIRFIELMPMGNGDCSKLRIESSEILKTRPWLIPISPRYISQPSVDYTAAGFKGRIGFISPVTNSFCENCNRVRITSDGLLRPCLGDDNEISLLDALKGTDEELLEIMRRAIFFKPMGHTFCGHGLALEKDMSKIGG
ncbi:MAG TPA: GTP 3',8-cyclase MoaA [Clostridia bacterium]|mgnify:CR=1 FL=1|nr:GTP 3',8-cyclase MoaA [Clostridia bacterium]